MGTNGLNSKIKLWSYFLADAAIPLGITTPLTAACASFKSIGYPCCMVSIQSLWTQPFFRGKVFWAVFWSADHASLWNTWSQYRKSIRIFTCFHRGWIDTFCHDVWALPARRVATEFYGETDTLIRFGFALMSRIIRQHEGVISSIGITEKLCGSSPRW